MKIVFANWLCLLGVSAVSAEPLPKQALQFFKSHCFECHAGEDDWVEGGVNLEMTSIDWSANGVTDLWSQVYDVVHSNEMPPRDADSFPTTEEREALLAWLTGPLTQHAPVGGKLPRRLNRVEYENTIRTLFGLTDFVVPPSFPMDEAKHGFDNVASGLILSPPLLAQYFEIATTIVDEVLPQPVKLPKVEPQIYPTALIPNVREAFGNPKHTRSVPMNDNASAASWTSPFEAPVSGIYRIRIDVQGFQTDNMFYERRETPFQMDVYARQNGQQVYAPFHELRLLGRFDVPADGSAPSIFQLDAELFKGDVVGVRWADGPVFSGRALAGAGRRFMDERLQKDRKFHAAILDFEGWRGITRLEFYQAIRKIMDSDKLDLNDPRLNRLPNNYGGGFSSGFHRWIKFYAVEEMLRFGPALDIRDVTIEGPMRVVPDPLTRKRWALSKQFLGERRAEVSDMAFAEAVLKRFLPLAFRRPVSEEVLQDFLGLIIDHRATFPKARLEDALHLAIRRALVSPYFLYRGLTAGDLDDWDLASRLSYFLNSEPPDAQLRATAASGKLSDPEVLETETRRLLAKPERKEFVRHFTGQWLSSRLLKEIMPDPRLIAFINQDREAMVAETELLFDEILTENYPLETFIDPGFSYRSRRLNKIYGDDLQGNEMRRVTFDKGGIHGGILGLASVLMATANGVDTHPVHRGVWLLENVLGQPTPQPQGDIPAVAPDTKGTTTMRELMAAHQAAPACARCHDRIDPLGFVMENFDPVGRWREFYPVYTIGASEKLAKEHYSGRGKGTRNGPAIDATATLPDGTVLRNVTDLKAYLLAHPKRFARCLTEKLLIYGTGRAPNFGDKRVVNDLAEQTNGFLDHIIAIVQSESFRTR